jgi:uncharacterized LabA/DUF88 family protein
MQRTAVFVDAGYVFAQGSILVAGSKQGRETLALDIPEIVKALSKVVSDKSSSSLLRIYWYDATRIGRPTPEQIALADTADIKIRLGQVNTAGEQKGVDALIITDLAQLARNQAITDAVLVSGDEDVRVGVVLAQEFGVRVHLVGISPARSNQSRSLMQEADTTTEWDQAVVRSFLSYSPPVAPTPSAVPATNAGLDAAVKPAVLALSTADLAALKQLFATSSAVPAEHDKTLLRIGRSYYQQATLLPPEKSALRAAFVRLVLAQT